MKFIEEIEKRMIWLYQQKKYLPTPFIACGELDENTFRIKNISKIINLPKDRKDAKKIVFGLLKEYSCIILIWQLYTNTDNILIITYHSEYGDCDAKFFNYNTKKMSLVTMEDAVQDFIKMFQLDYQIKKIN